MLTASDFTLVRTFFSDFSVSANPEFEMEDGYESCYLPEVHCIQRENGRYVVQLSITNDTKEEYECAYNYQVQAFAYLQIVDEALYGEDHRESATAYGVQVLFGSIREQLTLMTSRGPWKGASVNLELCDLRPIMASLKELWANEEA